MEHSGATFWYARLADLDTSSAFIMLMTTFLGRNRKMKH